MEGDITILLSNTSGVPIYRQIADQVREKILTGELEAGAMLPSIRQLAQTLRISVITTRRGYEELEREGLIETASGKGSFIASGDNMILAERRLRILEEHCSDAVAQAHLIQYPLDDLVRLISVLYKEFPDEHGT